MRYEISRRKFLKYTGSAAASLALGPFHLFRDTPVLRFGIVTDSHYADREPSGTRYYRESIAKMEAAMKEMNRQRVEFVVHLGDLKDQSESPDEETTLRYLQDIERSLSMFRGPRYHVLGNHDMDSISKDQFLANVVNAAVAPSKSYYSFDSGKVHFVVLDATYTKDGLPYSKGNFDWTDTYVPEDQRNWLRDDLSKTTLPAIVFIHQLLDDVDDLQFCVKNAKEVRAVLEKSKKVIAVFQGHRHSVRYNELEGIHYCTLPGMVDYSGLENNSFSVIEVLSTGINMTGYKRAPSRKFQTSSMK